MSDKELRVAELLIDLESCLRNLQCWDRESPSPSSLASVEPFCVDTMEFCQWLQWIFIPRIYGMIDSGCPLPAQCNIAPMGEEWAAMRGLAAGGLIALLQRLDEALSMQY